MIYLFGLNHNLQHNGLSSAPKSEREQFAEYVETKSRELGIGLIAEEFSEEALRKVSNASTSTAKAIATKLNIEHKFCDPNSEMRGVLGIPPQKALAKRVNSEIPLRKPEDILRRTDRFLELQRKHFLKREIFWAEKISVDKEKNVLFLCGADHVKSFGELLRGLEFEVAVLIEDWK